MSPKNEGKVIFKNPIQCENCRKTIGFRLGGELMGSAYCLAARISRRTVKSSARKY
jgi:hypothetical protein